MQTLNQDIKDRTFKPVYLLFGEEAFLKKSYKRNFPLTIRPRCTSGQAFETGRIVALCCKAGALGNFRDR